MHNTLKNRIRYSAETSRAISDACDQRRLAYNLGVEWTLKHPNISKNAIQRRLTKIRREDPEKWHGNVNVQRPGIFAGRNAVRQFHEADKSVLKECFKEEKLMERILDGNYPRKSDLPKPGNSNDRDINPRKLFQSWRSANFMLVHDSGRIEVLGPRRIKVDGIELRLLKPIPKGADVVSVHIFERKSSVRHRARLARRSPAERQSPASRSYEINLVIRVPDVPKGDILGSVIGLDAGIVHVLTGSNESYYHTINDRIEELDEENGKLEKSLVGKKRGSRSYVKARNAIKRNNKKKSNIKENAEWHIANEVAKCYDVVVMEDLNLQHLRKSPRGTPEYPGVNVAQKSGLNRSWANVRPGAMRTKIDRVCERYGKWCAKVDPRYTSQTCSVCGYTDRKNRQSQSLFWCRRCGANGNADHNAAIRVAQKWWLGIRAWLLLEYAVGVGNGEITDGRMGMSSVNESLAYLTWVGVPRNKGRTAVPVVSAGMDGVVAKS